MIWIFVSVFAVSFILCYGMFFGQLQRGWAILAEDDYLKDMGSSLTLALGFTTIPIVGLIVVYFLTDGAKYGLKFW